MQQIVEKEPPNRFINWEPPQIIHNIPTKWNWVVARPENLVLGNKVDVGCFTYIASHYGVILEDNVQIGSHCAIYSVSTIDGKNGVVHIKRNARIGSHSTVMPGVTIGENSIVGAHSFVRGNIPPNEVWYGVPAIFRYGGNQNESV